MQLKEDAEGPETGQRIRSLLVPMEYTRLDKMIDVMFTTAKGTAEAVKEAVAPASDDEFSDQSAPASLGKPEKSWQFTDTEVLRALREQIIIALGGAQATKFLRKSGALYWDAQHNKRVVCTLSKKYEQKGSAGYSYWYGYHQNWDEFLEGGSVSLIALGCVGSSFAFAIPWDKLHPLLSSLDTTTKTTGKYWHLRVAETSPGHFALVLAAGSGLFSLDAYKTALS